MHEGITPTKFGRIQSPVPLQMHRLHLTAPPEQLREVSWKVPIPVLDQEDLGAQGISLPALVPGARPADALGSCVANAATAHAAERLNAAGKPMPGACDGSGQLITVSPADARACEEYAILLYHDITSQTGNPATEWPPSDHGSSGYDACTELERLGYAATYKTASGIHGALSLLQHGTVMQGLPWFTAWFTPDSDGFIDGDGSADALKAAIESGVAGGHETLQTGIAQLAVTSAGTIDLARTVIECRNSWSAHWGQAGTFRVHASTLDLLSAYADYKAITI